MKRKTILLLLAIAALLGGIGWWALPGEPRLEFVEFRDGKNGREAVFKIVNHSRSHYGYPDYTDLAANIFYDLQDGSPIRTKFGVVRPVIQPYRISAIIPPGETRTIIIERPWPEYKDPGGRVDVSDDFPKKPFKVGIAFMRCDKDGWPVENGGTVRRFRNWLRGKFGKKPLTDEITWSESIQLPEKTDK